MSFISNISPNHKIFTTFFKYLTCLRGHNRIIKRVVLTITQNTVNVFLTTGVKMKKLLIILITLTSLTANAKVNLEVGVAQEQSSYQVTMDHLMYDNTDKASRTALTLGVGTDIDLASKIVYSPTLSVLEGKTEKWQNNTLKLNNSVGYKVTNNVTPYLNLEANHVTKGEYPVQDNYLSYGAGVKYNLDNSTYLKLDYSYADVKKTDGLVKFENITNTTDLKVGFTF